MERRIHPFDSLVGRIAADEQLRLSDLISESVSIEGPARARPSAPKTESSLLIRIRF